MFISAPRETPHAVFEGLMSHRAVYSGAADTVVDGNFRDLDEQRKLGYQEGHLPHLLLIRLANVSTSCSPETLQRRLSMKLSVLVR